MTLREALRGDAPAMAALIGELGFAIDQAGVALQLEQLAGAGEPVLLAEVDGAVRGLLGWHVMPTIHRERPVGRIVALIVADGWRGRGIGAALAAEAERRIRARDCEKLEVTSNLALAEAHAFYEGLGFERSSYRFAKDL